MTNNDLAWECQKHNIDHFLNIKTKYMPHSNVNNLSSINNWEVSSGSFES